MARLAVLFALLAVFAAVALAAGTASQEEASSLTPGQIDSRISFLPESTFGNPLQSNTYVIGIEKSSAAALSPIMFVFAAFVVFLF
jgi:hypothetical protein